MKTAHMLKFPALACKMTFVILGIAAISTTFIFVHIQIFPEKYSEWSAALLSQNGLLSYRTFERWNTDLSGEITLLSFDKITTDSLYFNYLQLMLRLLFIFLAVKELLNVIESVKQSETFQKINVLAFQKMSRYLFVVFILSSVTILNAREASLYSYSLQQTPLLLSVAAAIMAEIFKQGNRLLEENQLTI